MDDYLNKYGPRFFHSHKRNHEWWQIKVAQAIQDEFHFDSVFDFGCGIGSFLLGFYQSGVSDIGGCDARADVSKQFIDESIVDKIFQQDVTQPIDLGRTYDCIMSVETAEHFPPEGSETFLDNLTKHAERYIYLTAAVPGQRGKGHINCRPLDFWKTSMVVRDFAFLDEETKAMQKTCRGFIRRAAAVNNMMLFRKC